MRWCSNISLAFPAISVLFCGVLPLNRFFFSIPAPLQEGMKKDRVCVWRGGGMQEWYREIDEAVRAGVITRCPFPKPDWQTANITQTPGPDRHTTAPHPPTQTGEAESTPTFSLGLMVCGPTDFPMWYYSCRNWPSVYWQGKLLSWVCCRIGKAQWNCSPFKAPLTHTLLPVLKLCVCVNTNVRISWPGH